MFNKVLVPQLMPAFTQFVRPSAHSIYSPSSADRWLETGCPFSVKFILDHKPEEESSPYALEGTMAHELCEHMFRQEYYQLPIPSEFMMKVAMTDDHGEEMFAAARDYVDILGQWLNNKEVVGDVIFFGLEQGVPVFPEKSCFGTADFIIVGTKSAVLVDFKYGKKPVSASTLQLKVYAAGIARYLENLPEGYSVNVVIHQPRVPSAIKEHNYTMPELHEFLGTIWRSILKSEEPNLQPVEGNHCFWCPARRTKDESKKCPAILEKPVKLAEERFEAFLCDMSAPVKNLKEPNPKRDAAIAKLHALYPMIKQIVESTTEELTMRLTAGEVVPGFYLAEKLGNRVINGATDEEKAQLISSRYGIDAWKEIPATKKVKTITEIEKETKQKVDPICTRKMTKQVAIETAKTMEILGVMSGYAQMINSGDGHKE